MKKIKNRTSTTNECFYNNVMLYYSILYHIYSLN